MNDRELRDAFEVNQKALNSFKRKARFTRTFLSILKLLFRVRKTTKQMDIDPALSRQSRLQSFRESTEAAEGPTEEKIPVLPLKPESDTKEAVAKIQELNFRTSQTLYSHSYFDLKEFRDEHFELIKLSGVSVDEMLTRWQTLDTKLSLFIAEAKAKVLADLDKLLLGSVLSFEQFKLLKEVMSEEDFSDFKKKKIAIDNQRFVERWLNENKTWN